jgi:hypothetical protein
MIFSSLTVCGPWQERKVALVRITSNWAFTVKHLEMDPLWLRSSYLKVEGMDGWKAPKCKSHY